ncbi:MAG: hypothetical protein M1308_14570, partial [Actinobacteria bacterium]|nr:hypothetical protein [Actinomycetota bacterium]
MKPILILSNTTDQTEWAINYYLNHKTEKVIILTPNIQSQLLLNAKSIPSDDIFKVEKFDMNKVLPGEDKNDNVFYQSFSTIKILEKEADQESLTILGFNLISLLANNLAFIFPDIFHSFKTYQNIIKLWNPKIIFTPYTKERYVTGNKDDFYSLAHHIYYYFRNPLYEL